MDCCHKVKTRGHCNTQCPLLYPQSHTTIAHSNVDNFPPNVDNFFSLSSTCFAMDRLLHCFNIVHCKHVDDSEVYKNIYNKKVFHILYMFTFYTIRKNTHRFMWITCCMLHATYANNMGTVSYYCVERNALTSHTFSRVLICANGIEEISTH